MAVSADDRGKSSGAVTASGLASRPPWAQLLISLSPLTVVLVVYAVAQWVSAPISDAAVQEGATNRLGRGLHVAGPPMVDHLLFGRVPTVILQDAFAGRSASWYDAVCAPVYVTHYVVLPLVTLAIWFRHRERFRAWIAAVLGLTVVGIATYALYPAAPPWAASDRDVIGPVRRLSAWGWERLHLDGLGDLVGALQAGSNPVAAMPSLHAAIPVLVAVFLWNAVSRWWRPVLAGYAVLMAFVLVYTGEHYVVDVAAGWFLAAVAAVVGLVVERRRRRPDAISQARPRVGG